MLLRANSDLVLIPWPDHLDSAVHLFRVVLNPPFQLCVPITQYIISTHGRGNDTVSLKEHTCGFTPKAGSPSASISVQWVSCAFLYFFDRPKNERAASCVESRSLRFAKLEWFSASRAVRLFRISVPSGVHTS